MKPGTPIANPVPMPAPSVAGPHERVPRAPLSPAAINGRRAAAALIAVAWCAALAWLALATSNPVTLNRRQILSADAVVTVQITDRAAGACRVVRRWRGTAVPDALQVQGLAEASAREEGEWILPLQQTRRGYEVTPSALPSHARLVYPATAEAVKQLQRLVGEGE